MSVSDQAAKAQAMAAAPQTTVPSYARDFDPIVQPDGRLFLHGDAAGAHVYVLPKAWSTMRFAPDAATTAARPDAGAYNFAAVTGVQVPQLQAHAGQLQTNDPTLGASLLGSSAECRPAPRPAEPVVSTPVAGFLAVAVVAAAFIVRFKRSAPQ